VGFVIEGLVTVGPVQLARFERNAPRMLAGRLLSKICSSCTASGSLSANTPCSQFSQVERGSRL
jgi:hypothetical protein